MSIETRKLVSELIQLEEKRNNSLSNNAEGAINPGPVKCYQVKLKNYGKINFKIFLFVEVLSVIFFKFILKTFISML